MRRRDFIKAMAGSAIGWPLAVHAQQSGIPAVGFLGPGSSQSDTYRVKGFRQGLNEAGLVEGQNVTIEYRWAEGHYDRLPALAADLVNRRVVAIFTSSTPAALAAKAATATIPIVFETAGDPVQLGLVASLSRPGGNITGITQIAEEVSPKRIELLHELLPTVRTMALLVNPTGPFAEDQSRLTQSAAASLGLELHVLNASAESDFDAAFAELIELRAGGLVIGGDAFFSGHIEQLAAAALQHRVPAAYQHRDFTVAGGLMSYGSSITETHRLAAIYIGRILKGDKPADLPVQQATKVELYINLKTAKALGVSVPIPILGRADEVIE